MRNFGATQSTGLTFAIPATSSQEESTSVLTVLMTQPQD